MATLPGTEIARSELARKLYLDNHNNETFKLLVLGKTPHVKLTELESIWISKLRTSKLDGLNSRVDQYALCTGITKFSRHTLFFV